MGKTVLILGIAGSLRRKSYKSAALCAATQLAPKARPLMTDEATREHIRRLLRGLVDWTRRIGDKEKAGDDERGAAPALRPTQMLPVVLPVQPSRR